MKSFFNQYIKNNFYAAAAYNILLVMLLFTLCRVVFYLFNADFFNEMTFGHFIKLCRGGLQFDLTAVLYTNILYFLLMLIPFGFRKNHVYQLTAKWIFIITNSIALIANCADIIYYRFTLRRTTTTVFSEFSNENNLLKIIGTSVIQYWYVTLFALLIVFALWYFYHTPKPENTRKTNFLYYLKNTAAMLLFIAFFVIAARGGVGAYVRPITLSNANLYVNKANEASIVLNTPFSIYRTIGKRVFKNPEYFKTEELNKIYNPIIFPKPSGDFKNLNVVIFIMESFSKEYVGELNKDLDGGTYKGYTPFLDSLIREGLTFEYTFANGHRSIEAMPSVLSSIPSFFEPYFLTSYSSNNVSGIAGELNKKGYYSAFFHGAPNGSMGFGAFANISGYKNYFGMNEYDGDKDSSFDGTWALWDEDFFQFFARKMNNFQQPFITTMFSASSHHPFRVPKKYIARFTEKAGNIPIYKCVEYSDFALQRFFETASKSPWFENTLFVITADHSNGVTHTEYLNDAGFYKVPIVFYTPNGALKGRFQKIAQQIDIMPTVLGYLNYEQPFVAFGQNLLDTTNVSNAIMYHKPFFQYFEGNYMYQFDENEIIAVYDFVNDNLLKHNLIQEITILPEIENKIKAYIQQYVLRMMNNQLTLDE